jgi:[ribosomal protein S5]-alanine N-acetyltransferase
LKASSPESLLETPRLLLREVGLSDAPFLLRLLNDPSWLENIGDRGVRSVADAELYVRNRIWSEYQTHGYGMYAVQLRSTGLPIGICGLVKREFLTAPDLGFALLPEYVGQGHASEAARGLLVRAEKILGIAQLYAIAKRDNRRSVRVLSRLGFRHQGPYVIPEGLEIELYAAVAPFVPAQ